MTAMIKPTGNPWLQMPKDSARRVDIETSYNFFWITDSKGRYGLLITFGFLLGDIEIEDKVKGISIIKSSNGPAGKLYFVLNNNKDWEIFYQYVPIWFSCQAAATMKQV
jgi:hypothetical protein